MESSPSAPLRVMTANETGDHAQEIAALATALGQQVVAQEVRLSEAAATARAERPDLALVGTLGDTDHALDMIGAIVDERICPVVALTSATASPEFVAAAAQRGIYAFASPLDHGELQGAVDVAVRRFGQYADLEGAMNRREGVDCAKGILMERYSVDEQKAFELLRRQARSSNLKVADAARFVIGGHRLLPKTAA